MGMFPCRIVSLSTRAQHLFLFFDTAQDVIIRYTIIEPAWSVDELEDEI